MSQEDVHCEQISDVQTAKIYSNFNRLKKMFWADNERARACVSGPGARLVRTELKPALNLFLEMI